METSSILKNNDKASSHPQDDDKASLHMLLEEDSERIEKGPWRNDKQHGRTKISFYENGNLDSEYLITYNKGERNYDDVTETCMDGEFTFRGKTDKNFNWKKGVVTYPDVDFEKLFDTQDFFL